LKRLRPLSYPQTNIFFLNYSCVNPNSFINIREKWYPEVSHHCPDAIRVLVATKYDLINDEKVLEKLASKNQTPITKEQGIKMAKECGCIAFCENSARNQEGVQETFDMAIKAYFLSKLF